MVVTTVWRWAEPTAAAWDYQTVERTAEWKAAMTDARTAVSMVVLMAEQKVANWAVRWDHLMERKLEQKMEMESGLQRVQVLELE